MEVTTTQVAVGLLGSALSGGLPSMVFQWLSRRRRRRILSESGIDQAVQDAVKLALSSTTAEINRLNAKSIGLEKRATDLEAEIERLKEDHARELADLTSKHDDCEARGRRQDEEINRLRSIIDKVMKDTPPAEYRPTDLRRVGGKN